VKTRLIVPALAALVSLASRADESAPASGGGTSGAPVPVQATGAEDGPHEVLTLAFPDLRDGDRDGRSIPIKVHYPATKGPWPLAVWSHGGAGNWDGFLNQARHLASHGYISVCVEHVFSNTTRVRKLTRASRAFGIKAKVKNALLRIVADSKSVLERPRDVSFAIDRAIEWSAGGGPLAGRIDTSKIAVIGHSYGAYTALAVCGAQPILDYLDPPVAPGKGLAGDLSDSRVTVGIAMSPQGPGTSRFSEASYATIDRPLLCLSGSEDNQLGHDGRTQPAEVRLRAFELMPNGGKIMVWLANADHLAFADNPKVDRLPPSPSRPDTQRITKALTLAFCDVHLKGDETARARLSEKHARSLCGEVVTELRWLEK
jgi:predicted dienelactone hydrolase